MDLDPDSLLHDLETVIAVSRAMGSERDLDRLLELIVRSVSDLIEAERTSLFIVDQDSGELWTRVAQASTEIRLPRGKGIAGTAAATGQTINIPSAYDDPRFDPANDRRTGFRTRSILCMPLISYTGTVVGVVQALNKHGRDSFDAHDEWALSALCSQAAVAIDNAQLVVRDLERQRLERDMELAREIQLSLLPTTPPQVAGWKLSAWAQTCDETGGDYFDFLPIADGVDTVVGDVTGHGIGAAMLMSTARAFLRALHSQGLPPAVLVAQLNRLLEADMADDTFMSLSLCRLRSDGGATCTSAGHESPLVFRLGRGFDEPVGSGLLLGLLDDSAYDEQTIAPLVAGDLLVVVSDGVFEAQPAGGGAEWGMEALRATIAELAHQGGAAVCAGVVQRIAAHLGGRSPHDDVTIVVAERT